MLSMSTALLLTGQPEQPRGVAAQDRDLFFVRQRRGGEDMIDRMFLPGDRMIAAEHDLAGPDLRREMAQGLRGEHQGIEIELVEIFARLLSELDVGIAVLRCDEAGVVGARGIGAEITAAVGGDKLEGGK